MVTTVIIDSQKQERDKIVSYLSAQSEIKVLAYGKDGYDALKLTGNLKPDIVLLDNNLEFIEGGEIPPLLRIRSAQSAVVILTERISDYQLSRAVHNEVSGFVHKEKDMEALPFILKWIARGECYISPYIASRVLQLVSGMNRNDPLPRGKLPGEDPAGFLSKMELRILTCIGEGYTSDEIAGKSELAVGTVRNYISTVMHKTGLHNRSQLARYACYYGLVPLRALSNKTRDTRDNQTRDNLLSDSG